jgi:hypothetical protein
MQEKNEQYFEELQESQQTFPLPTDTTPAVT